MAVGTRPRMAVGMKEGVATLACAVVVALLVVAGDSSGYTGFGQVSLSLFFTLVTGPRRSLRLKLSDALVYAP